MGVLTNLLKLLKPSENDYYNQQTEQADNWDKVDNYAVLTNTDKNGIWGGEYGGKIQDPIPKELNKRYIDNINGKAFICIKAGDSSVVSNTIEYFTPCNVADNLAKLQNLIAISSYYKENVDVVSGVMSARFAVNAKKRGNVVTLTLTVMPLDVLTGPTSNKNINIILPEDFKPLMPVYGLVRTDQRKYQAAFNLTQDGISYEFSNQAEVGAGMGGTVTYTT